MDGPAPPPNPYEAPRANVDAPAVEPDDRDELASRWRRLGGALIDGTLVGLTSLPRTLAFGGTIQCGVNIGQAAFRPDDLSDAGIVTTLLFIALVAVQSFFIATQGQSIGKRVAGARIVTMSGAKPTFLNAVVLRTWLPLIVPLLPLGSLLAVADVLFIFSRDKRCLHDRIAGTKVIEAVRPGHDFEPR